MSAKRATLSARSARLAGLAVACCFALTATTARAEEDPPANFGAFQDRILNQVGGEIDKELAGLKTKLADPKTPKAERAKLEAKQAKLKTAKGAVDNGKMAKGLWDSIQNAKNAMKEIADGVGGDSSGNSAINANFFEGDKVNKLFGSKNLNRLNTGLDYYNKIDALAGDLKGVRDAGLTPGATKLSYALTTMTAIMSNFGDKVPLIGDIVKAYGDLGGQLLKNAIALENKVKASEGGQIRPGVHGARKGMLDKLHKAGFNGASYIPGLYDAFETDNGKIVIWDRKAGDWVVASDMEPGLSKEELVKRYLHYAKQGIKTPGPELLLKAFKKTVKLTLTPSKDHLAPGETIDLKVTGRLVRDEKSAPRLYVKVVQVSNTGIGTGSFSGSTTVRIGESVKWTAPDNVNETYVFSVDLDPDVAKETAISTGPAKAKVRTGSATKIVITADPVDVLVGEDVTVTAKITDGDGKPLDANASGWVSIDVSPDKGYLRMSTKLDGQKGIKQVWHAPDKAGAYTFTAKYDGATAYGMFSTHTAGSEASVVVKVKEPSFDLSVDKTSQPAKKDKPAVFEVTLSNREQKKLTFELRKLSGPRGQSHYWRSGRPPATVTLDGGAEKKFQIKLRPDDEDKATTFKVKITAVPKAGRKGKSVLFAATNKKDEGKLLVKVKASSQDGSKARANGKAALETEVSPGGSITLAFRPWGKRRVYCTKDVVKKSKNMRQVELFSHGADGCSFGTRDGRMHSEWTVVEEKVTWSGPGVKAGSGKKSYKAKFKVPDKPGTYTVSAQGTVKWKYRRKAPGGVVNKAESESGSGSFTIEVKEKE